MVNAGTWRGRTLSKSLRFNGGNCGNTEIRRALQVVGAMLIRVFADQRCDRVFVCPGK